MVIHDTEWPYGDHVSLSNTKLNSGFVYTCLRSFSNHTLRSTFDILLVFSRECSMVIPVVMESCSLYSNMQVSEAYTSYRTLHDSNSYSEGENVGTRGQVDRVMDSRSEGLGCPLLVMCRSVGQTSYSILPWSTDFLRRFYCLLIKASARCTSGVRTDNLCPHQDIIDYLLGKRGYVFESVGLCVCLSVC